MKPQTEALNGSREQVSETHESNKNKTEDDLNDDVDDEGKKRRIHRNE